MAGNTHLSGSIAEDFVWAAIKATINKFREHPAFFFTESDITSYLYKRLYTSRFAVTAHDRLIYCVHREYPTNFRYERQNIVDSEVIPSLIDPVGKRGHYDLAVLNPDFVINSTIYLDVVNKNIKGLQERSLDGTEEDLLFAIELKYVISNAKEWATQIAIDNSKLKQARQHNVRNVVNLVFCNNPGSASRVANAIHSAEPDVCAILTESTYDKTVSDKTVKSTPKPIINSNYVGAGRIALGW